MTGTIPAAGRLEGARLPGRSPGRPCAANYYVPTAADVTAAHAAPTLRAHGSADGGATDTRRRDRRRLRGRGAFSVRGGGRLLDDFIHDG